MGRIPIQLVRREITAGTLGKAHFPNQENGVKREMGLD